LIRNVTAKNIGRILITEVQDQAGSFKKFQR